MSGFLAKVNNRAAASTTRTTTSGKSSVARTAAKNITGSKTATGNISGLRTSSSNDFGIWAKRSTPGTGAQYDVKGYNSASLSAARHAYNDNHTKIFNDRGWNGFTHNSNSAVNKYAAAMMAMGVLGSLTEQIVNAKNTSKTK